MARRALQRFRAIATSLPVLLVLSVFAPASLVALAAWWTYSTHFQAAVLDAQDTADLLQEYVRQRLDDAAVPLRILRDTGDRPGEQADSIAELLKFYPRVTGAFIVDRGGEILFASSPAAAAVAGSDAFRALEAADRPLYFDLAPGGAETALLALRRDAPDGTFDGFVGMSVKTASLRALFDHVAAGRPAVALLCRTDGTIIARAPAGAGATGHLPATAPLLVDLQQASAGSFLAPLLDGGATAIVAYHSVTPYPLVVAYGIDHAAVLASWQPIFAVIAATGMAAAFGLLTATVAVRRGQTALVQRERRLEAEIARRREAEAETRRSLEEALRANTAKSGFLAMMSHELRTPLNAIIGFSEMMSNEMFGPLGNERYKTYVADIAQSGTHLLKVISDILDLSRIDLGRLKPDVDTTDVLGLVEQTIRMVTPIASKAGITVALTAPRDLPGAVADARLLKQALLNVLSNAIKFTMEGGRIDVRAQTLPDDALLIELRDTGIGMTPDQLKLALEPFMQVDNSMHRKYEGAGLGLPLAKAFIELQGGTFEIHSEPGRGTTIRFVLQEAAG
jgi:signal transduction histidine kinase